MSQRAWQRLYRNGVIIQVRFGLALARKAAGGRRNGLNEAEPDADGLFAFTNRFNPPLKFIAVWISSDGDDAHSSFGVTLNMVRFSTQEAFALRTE